MARQASSANCPTACECWFVPGARKASWLSTGRSAFVSSSNLISVKTPNRDSLIGTPPPAKMIVNKPPLIPNNPAKSAPENDKGRWATAINEIATMQLAAATKSPASVTDCRSRYLFNP